MNEKTHSFAGSGAFRRHYPATVEVFSFDIPSAFMNPFLKVGLGDEPHRLVASHNVLQITDGDSAFHLGHLLMQ
jgi:hypothetical protein